MTVSDFHIFNTVPPLFLSLSRCNHCIMVDCVIFSCGFRKPLFPGPGVFFLCILSACSLTLFGSLFRCHPSRKIFLTFFSLQII